MIIILNEYEEKTGISCRCWTCRFNNARVLADNAIKVKILEKRNHIAGNSYDFINSNNERIHKYGPHLLHCNKNSKALSFLNRFTDWINYEHKVRALLSDGRTTPLPINQITLEDIFNKKFCND